MHKKYFSPICFMTKLFLGRFLCQINRTDPKLCMGPELFLSFLEGLVQISFRSFLIQLNSAKINIVKPAISGSQCLASANAISKQHLKLNHTNIILIIYNLLGVEKNTGERVVPPQLQLWSKRSVQNKNSVTKVTLWTLNRRMSSIVFCNGIKVFSSFHVCQPILMPC